MNMQFAQKINFICFQLKNITYSNVEKLINIILDASRDYFSIRFVRYDN